MIKIKLKELLKSRNMSMLVLSENAQVSYPAILRMCNHLSRIDVATINSICNALDCDLSDILEYTKDNEDENNENSIKNEETR